MRTKIKIVSILIFISMFITYNIGIKNYKKALNIIVKYDSTDAEIVETLHEHGFNLDIYEEPNIWDYIKSGFTHIK